MTKETLIYIITTKQSVAWVLSDIEWLSYDTRQRQRGMYTALGRLRAVCEIRLDDGHIKAPFVTYLINECISNIYSTADYLSSDGAHSSLMGVRAAYDEMLQTLEDI